ncbi:MAG: chromosomal replication initiator protein DnaA, partial [Bacteroidales bacterium]|nr:chromosomal replication initiator protein DnaA [Bacteroidales bacterium]
LEPGTTPFNPMFVHSGTGLGKTHLLHAIGMLTKENHSNLNVLYTNWEDFTRQWVEASKSNTSIVEFQNFYHSIDVLLIDDINRVHGRNATQEAFFNVFNDLHQRNKQIVMASDRSPADLEGLESRLLSRFKWGLIDQLIMPDIETRIKIIKQKMIDNGVMSIPESVIENIAYSATSNVRELEGVLNSILAHSIMLKDSSQITAEFANSIIDKFIRNSSKEISMDYIKNVICDFLKVPPSDINSKARKSNIVKARQLIMYFAKLHTKASLEQIGRQCGDKNHATVIHAIKTVTNLAETEHSFKKTVDELENKLTIYGTANFDTKLHR